MFLIVFTRHKKRHILTDMVGGDGIPLSAVMSPLQALMASVW
jgi:hypothetical protein